MPKSGTHRLRQKCDTKYYKKFNEQIALKTI